MPVFGSNNGIFDTNLDRNRVSHVVTVEELRRSYLFGIPIENFEGEALSDATLQLFIDNAVSNLEHYLDISITPRSIEEDQDYAFNQYWDWGYFKLQNFPVIQVDSMELIYFKDNDGVPEVIKELPASWIRLQPHDGIIRLIPNSRFSTNFQVGNNGAFFPQILKLQNVPHLWKLKYVAGFDHGKVPYLVNQAIALVASIQALIIAGNLVVGAGIAAESISIDGLSQSITTTSSAENSAYSATIKEYQRLLYGSRAADSSSIMGKLKTYWKGETISII